MTESDFSLFPPKLLYIMLNLHTPGTQSAIVHPGCALEQSMVFSRESGITLSRAISARSPSVPVWFISKRERVCSLAESRAPIPHTHPHPFRHSTLIRVQLLVHSRGSRRAGARGDNQVALA